MNRLYRVAQDLFAKKKTAEITHKRTEITSTIKQTAAKIEMLDRLPSVADDKAIVARIRRTLGAQLAEVGRDFQHNEVKEIRQRSSRAGALHFSASLTRGSDQCCRFSRNTA